MADGIMNKEDLLRLTLRQLRQQASKLSVPLYSRKTKAVLVDLIVSYQDKAVLKAASEKKHGQNLTSDNKMAQETAPVTEQTNVTKLVFLPRDPEWAYVFWEISDSDRERAQSLGANKLCLRLFDVTGVSEGNFNKGTMREIAVDSFSTEWYLPIPVADRDYKVELGYRYGFEWMSLAFSAPSHVPSSHPSEQILDKFVPFNLDSSMESTSLEDVSFDNESDGLHERLYHAATTYPRRTRVGSEEFMENVSSKTQQSNLNDSGTGIWASGLNDSGSGIQNRSFWLVADAELIVYGATDPEASLTIGDENVPLASDGTFRLQVPFRDGNQNYAIEAIDSSGSQKRKITMNFVRTTPLDDTTSKDKVEKEWFE